MDIQRIEEGKIYSYFPTRSVEGDTVHYLARVEKITARRVRVRVFMQGASEDGVVKSVSARSLVDHHELFGDGIGVAK